MGMKIVRIGNGRLHEVPETWAEAERMIAKGTAYHDDRGSNLAQMSIAARVAYGMYGEKWMAADPTQALMFLMMKICDRKGAGLEKD
jgi:hypothetical protein